MSNEIEKTKAEIEKIIEYIHLGVTSLNDYRLMKSEYLLGLENADNANMKDIVGIQDRMSELNDKYNELKEKNFETYNIQAKLIEEQRQHIKQLQLRQNAMSEHHYKMRETYNQVLDNIDYAFDVDGNIEVYSIKKKVKD